MLKKALIDKIKESLSAILPIALIVVVLSLTLIPLNAGLFVLFIIGVFLLILGMGLFTQGADMSMLVIGEKIGSAMTKSKKIWLIALLSFIIGIIVTVAEPDLQILARQVPAIAEKTPLGNYLLIIVVSAGVGIFLVIAMLRIILKIRLSVLLIAFYAVAFLLCIFVPPSFWAVSFDAGGVTTGPMTVPFIISLGMGVASLRAGKGSRDDSFGLVALSSVGPIVATLVLGIIFKANGIEYDIDKALKIPESVSTTRGILSEYAEGFRTHGMEVAVAVSPIIIFFLIFEVATRSFKKRQVFRILFGFIYTYVGLVLFLTGADTGFMPVGRMIGEEFAGFAGGWLLIPVGMLIGYFVVAAEPAVHVLTKQVERISAGAIGEKAMKRALCIGVSISLGLAMVRILTHIGILWILLPGYGLALLLTFFTPPLYTGIAFDSGGVASGAMVSSFVLPLAFGACYALNGGSEFIMTDAFGCVAFVALTPLITIQLLGIYYRIKTRKIKRNFITAEEKILVYEVD